MKRRMNFAFVLAVGCCGLLLAVADAALAVDCSELRSQALAETSLLKKRDLLEKAVAKCPRDAQLNFNYAKTLERLRKYEDALKYYKIASGYSETRASSYFGMGDIYALLSKPEEAVESYEKGLKYDPADERARNSMEELKKKHGIRGTAARREEPPPPPPPVQEPPKPAPQETRPSQAPEVRGPDLDFQEPF